MLSEIEIERLSQLVRENYSHICAGVMGVHEVDAYECNNRNYQVQTQEESDVSKLLLKKFVTLETPKVISEILRVIDYCYSKGVKVPRVLRTDADELFFQENGSYYCALEFYEGHHFSGSIEELQSAAQGLALLHKVLEDYDLTIHRKEDKLHQFLKEDELEKIKNILGKDPEGDFNRMVQKNLGEISHLYGETEDELFSVDLPRQLIHNDFHRMNGLFRDGELVVILDFDGMDIAERVRDVAFSCYRFSRYTREGLVKEKIIPRATEFLDNYCSRNPLTDEEISIIPTILTHEALRRVSSILRLHYFYHDTMWSFDLPKHLRTIEDAQYLKNIS